MEQTTRKLAIVLPQLQRSPGKDERWVEKAVLALERTRPEDCERLINTESFAVKLAALLGVAAQETASLSLGLFFHNAIAKVPTEGEPSRAWADYVVANEEALGEALAIVRAIRAPAGDGWTGGLPAAIARVAVQFDTETRLRRRGPLQLLTELRATAESPVMERIVEELWSERGQELCAQAARGISRASSALGAELSESLKLLRGFARPKALVPPNAPPARLSGAIERVAKGGDSNGDLIAGIASGSENFDRRKKALRASLAAADPSGLAQEVIRDHPADGIEEIEASPPAPAFDFEAARQPESLVAEDPASPFEVKRSLDDMWRTVTTDPAAPEDGPADLTAKEPPVRERPRAATDPESILKRAKAATSRDPEPIPSKPKDAIRKERAQSMNDSRELPVNETIEALRARLDRIERSATEAQQLIAALGPQLDEMMSWASDLEDVFNRWSRQRTPTSVA